MATSHQKIFLFLGAVAILAILTLLLSGFFTLGDTKGFFYVKSFLESSKEAISLPYERISMELDFSGGNSLEFRQEREALSKYVAQSYLFLAIRPFYTCQDISYGLSREYPLCPDTVENLENIQYLEASLAVKRTEGSQAKKESQLYLPFSYVNLNGNAGEISNLKISGTPDNSDILQLAKSPRKILEQNSKITKISFVATYPEKAPEENGGDCISLGIPHQRNVLVRLKHPSISLKNFSIPAWMQGDIREGESSFSGTDTNESNVLPFPAKFCFSES